MMYPIIDFRNARYQGQSKNELPNGVGILLDKNQLFCLAEWNMGEIQGAAVVIFPSGKIFCGHIRKRQPQQLNTY